MKAALTTLSFQIYRAGLPALYPVTGAEADCERLEGREDA
jgi:hypothetical protein